MISVHAKSAIFLSRSWRNRAASLGLKQASKRPGRSASFVTSGSQNENNPGAENDGVCLLSERPKYQSWPSEEHAAFAFARLASPGRTSIGPSEFISVLKRMQLDFNLGDHELKRVFDSLDANSDGALCLEEFKSGRGDHPFTKTLVETLSGSCPLFTTADHFPDPDFDSRVSTAEFYSAPLESGFVGENVAIRKSLDYSYHGNYTKNRQLFQDALIKSNVLLNGSGSDKPWYVLTCGPMGAGKGWVLGWMSATGILELERVSKIDPDAFKLRMPEWQIYQEHGMTDVAGTRTHAESSYIAEIAQHVAMNNNMDVWIDGSLRNWKWYEIELQRIRKRYPQYRIAIIAISASEEMIESNIKRRAMETGRDIPDELRQATTNDEIGNGIVKLTHLVDLVASVRNTPADEESDENLTSEPVLRFVSMVDRSGNWDLIRELTSSHQ
mmetsp:Transcript_43325/g.79300  ORF Transcript_43325/g.79300 Transcript_43325/m.79300 type:complete len:442 (+) Transcript_43325:207-1532(+)|eukprot:CAMPEP_0202022872 /NCGR_PEP_ID=MMETSP0905-20130828/50532_1 /ASSEMBLY_ACC=CAM_ASM_000554 /TAXON_ID=420261 /ORGANISM="Thalassiosira antarctica, Strain CCMP982" /LENGTH=441 /DNA_ID=CAMNT_0048585119 /DNA_START=139 /DNA_END=1464 /DNA_ORIENTATION=+